MKALEAGGSIRNENEYNHVRVRLLRSEKDSQFLSGEEKKWRTQRKQCTEHKGRAWCRITYYGQDYNKLRYGRDVARQLFVVPKDQQQQQAASASASPNVQKTVNAYADKVSKDDIIIHMRFNENFERD